MDWTRGSWRHRTLRKRPAGRRLTRGGVGSMGCAVARLRGRFAVLWLEIGTLVRLRLRGGALAGRRLFAVRRGRILPGCGMTGAVTSVVQRVGAGAGRCRGLQQTLVRLLVVLRVVRWAAWTVQTGTAARLRTVVVRRWRIAGSRAAAMRRQKIARLQAVAVQPRKIARLYLTRNPGNR